LSHEILYTSAPEGLKPGTRGFCTVVATEGMARNLAERLEALSGYRHAFPPTDPRAAQNPVNYSHLILKVGGREYHVLSRIADAGLDYTKRTNKLAHHVALESEEFGVGGPAWVLADLAFCVPRWDGTVKTIPTGRAPRRDPCPLAECEKWQQITGDAGWAGVLAESVLDTTGRTFSVIFRPGMPTLALMVEALSLLPPQKRWEVTFSTYFTAPAAADYQWRFLLDDTLEARTARNNPHAPLIDLCRPLGKAPGSGLVEAARTGRFPEAADAAATVGGGAAYNLRSRPKAAGVVAPPVSARPAAGEFGLPPLRADDPFALADAGEHRFSAPRKKPHRIELKVGLGCLVLSALLAAYYLGAQSGQQPTVPGDKRTTEVASNPSNKEETPSVASKTTVKSEEPKKPPPKPKNSPRGQKRAKPAPKSKVVEPANPPVAEKPPPVPEEKRPLADVRRKKGLLPLPALSFTNLTGDAGSFELAKVLARSTDCQLSLDGDEDVLAEKSNFEVKQQDQSDGSRVWTVQTPAVGLAPGLRMGKFVLRNQTLTFQWDSNVREPKYVQLLRFHILNIQAGGEKDLCVLFQPLEVEINAKNDYKWENGNFVIPLREQTLAEFKALQMKSLRLDVRLQGMPKHDVDISGGLTVDDRVTARFLEPGEGDIAIVELNLTFYGRAAERPGIAVSLVGYKPGLVDAKHSLSRKTLNDEKARYSVERELKLAEHKAAATKKVKETGSALDDFERNRKSVDAELKSVNGGIGELRKIDPKNRTRDQQQLLSDLEHKAADDLQPRLNAAVSAVRQYTQQLESDRRQLSELKLNIDNIQKRRGWYEKMEQIFNEIQKGRIDYRIYAKILGKEAVLVRSKGFPADAGFEK
jgi:hypothetical protein